MSLQYKFFTISIKDTQFVEEEINKFLRSIQVITIHRELLLNGENSCWLLAVEYQTGEGAVGSGSGSVSGGKSGIPKKKVDYREVLSPEDFTIYARLREWRKETAAKESVQLYTIFTNEQMANMVLDRIITKTGIKGISGVGDARVDKYGQAVVEILIDEFGKLKKNDEK